MQSYVSDVSRPLQEQPEDESGQEQARHDEAQHDQGGQFPPTDEGRGNVARRNHWLTILVHRNDHHSDRDG